MKWPDLVFPPINLWSLPKMSKDTAHSIALKKADAGEHYRFSYKGIKLDPFRIAEIYKMQSFAMMTILKKCLCAGNRGHKDYEQDLKDIICAAQRELEIMMEDNE